jgi:hypothetical protein
MLMAGANFSRDRREPRRQIFDVAIAKMQLQPVAKALAADEAGSGEIEIEITEDALGRQLARPYFKIVEMTRRVATADDCANRCTSDDVGLYAGFLQCS